jgi:putative DNA-invertase from lambdoid prophage Rac
MPSLETMTDRPQRACLYLRTSTDRQFTDNQRPAVEQLAGARGYEIAHVYEEQVSAVARHRPAWEALKLAAHQGVFDVVVVVAIDRIGRSLAANVQEILSLDKMGIEVVSVREPWLSTQGPVRDLLIAIFSWLAQEERRQIAARSQAGVERARKLGKQIGRPKADLDITKAVALRDHGLSVREVARQLGVSRSVVHRALQGVPDPNACGTARAA